MRFLPDLFLLTNAGLGPLGHELGHCVVDKLEADMAHDLDDNVVVKARHGHGVSHPLDLHTLYVQRQGSKDEQASRLEESIDLGNEPLDLVLRDIGEQAKVHARGVEGLLRRVEVADVDLLELGIGDSLAGSGDHGRGDIDAEHIVASICKGRTDRPAGATADIDEPGRLDVRGIELREEPLDGMGLFGETCEGGLIGRTNRIESLFGCEGSQALGGWP